MESDPKNKGTLFSSTLKVGEIKVDLFPWSEFILVSSGDFVVSGRYQKITHKLKTTKSSYLPQMTSDLKNKVTLFSSTLKVEKGKMHSFSWSEFILVSFGNFVDSWRYWKTPQKSQNDKMLISPPITPD